MRWGKPHIRDLLGLMRPQDALGQNKIRLGSDGDGGYVLLDDFAGIERAIGCGVGGDISFEHALAERGIAVDLFDHSVPELPVAHPRFAFHRLKVSDGAPSEAPCVTLDGIAALHRLAAASAILKVDIEGNEWPLFRAVHRRSLRRYRQIIVELHWLDRAGDRESLAIMLAAMRKLHRDFAVVHVHANNFGPLVDLAGLQIPQVLELTLANRARYRLRPSQQEFPTPLDRPNNQDSPDLPLGRFDFAHG